MKPGVTTSGRSPTANPCQSGWMEGVSQPQERGAASLEWGRLPWSPRSFAPPDSSRPGGLCPRRVRGGAENGCERIHWKGVAGRLGPGLPGEDDLGGRGEARFALQLLLWRLRGRWTRWAEVPCRKEEIPLSPTPTPFLCALRLWLVSQLLRPLCGCWAAPQSGFLVPCSEGESYRRWWGLA